MFFTITKVDQARREVGGIVSCQKEDKDGETLDYEGSKPHFQAWSDEAYNATKALGTGNVSYGNLREQHSKRCVGKFVEPLAFDDQKKTIRGVAKVYDDDVWQKVSEGVYNAFSVGGGLVGPPKRSGATKLITIVPREISLVDNPALDATHFDFVRAADGSTVQKLFKSHDDESRLKSALENLEQALKAYYAPDAISDENSPHANQSADDQAHLSAEAGTHDATAAHRVGEPDTQAGLHDSEPKADMIGLDTKTEKGAIAMNEVEKAARLSLHDHLSKIKTAVTKHKEMAAAHEASVHDLCDKCMKLAGGPEFKPETENSGAGASSGNTTAATDTEVKAAKAQIEKLVATVKTLTEKIDASDKAAKDATEKAAADKAAADKAAADKAAADKKAAEEREKAANVHKLGIVGDRTKAVTTGQTPTEKAAAAQKEAEQTMELAKAAFGVDVVKVNGEERIQRTVADPNAMDALYSKLAKRGHVPDGSAKSLGVA